MNRNLANSIPDAATFHTIVQSVITDNSFRCTDYSDGGEYHAPVEKLDETYTARILYKSNGTFIGRSEDTYNTFEDSNAGVAAVMANNQQTLAHGGVAMHESSYDSYDATLRCYDPHGEIYILTFSREGFTLAAYSDDIIRKKVEIWADSIPSLKEMPVEQRDGSLRQ